MRILKIRFKNINSFYGEHPCIDFGVHPLQATGLFMISGPTGAGKSTLLDVISLALYNRVPRFAAKTLSSKQIEQNGSIINATAYDEPNTDAFAEVEYEVKNKCYRSRWSITKNRKDNWKNYSMEIAELPSGILLDIKGLSNFPKENERLIGLNYNQFIQSILLAQGNFSEFLRASSNERSKLLEDITGTHIYRTIGEAAYRKHKTVQEEIKAAESLLSGIELMTDEDREKQEAVLTKKMDEQTQLAGKVEHFRQQAEQKKLHQQAHRGLHDTKTKQDEWLQEYEVFRPKLVRLQRHVAVADLAKPLSDFENLLNNVSVKKRQLNDLANLKDKQESYRQTILNDAATAFNQHFSVDDFSQILSVCKEKVSGIQKEMDDLISAGAATSRTIENAIQQSKDEFINSLKPKNYGPNTTALADYRNKLNAVKSGVTAREIDEVDTLETRQNYLGKWIEKYGEIDKVTTQGKSQKQRLQDLQNAQKNQTKDLKNQAGSLEKITVELEKLRKEKEAENNQVDLIKLRDELSDGEPCLVCGSTQHPYRQHVVKVLGELEVALLSKERAVKEATQAVNDLYAELKVTESKIEQSELDLKELKQEYVAIDTQCKAFAEQLGLPPKTPVEDLEMEFGKVSKKRVRINEFIRQKSTLESIDLLLALTLENHQRSADYQVLDTKKKQVYNGENLEKDCQKLNNDWTKTETALSHYEKQSNELALEVNQLIISVETNREDLSKQLNAKGLPSIQAAKEQLLSSDTVQALQSEKQLLEKQQTTLETQKEAFENQLKMASEKITAAESFDELTYKINSITLAINELNREIGHVRAILEADTTSRVKQESQLMAIANMKAKSRKWDALNNYIGCATGDVFSNFAQGLTLNNLIALANQRLKHLSDRYLLTKHTADSDTLRVMDLFQGQAERSVDTLSGGETFTISLAMALALSDLASQNVRLDSLFIDEGFGTLDAETLETAIGTLEKLQLDSKKTVGVISHRQELIDRISTQIRVQKSNDGKSSVAVVGF